MPSEPLEEVVLEAIKAALAAVVAGSDYFFSCEYAARVQLAQAKHFGEVADGKFLALIEADGMLYTQASPGVNCGTNEDAQVIVTLATKYKGPDSITSPDFNLPTIQQHLVHDVRKALHEQALVDGVNVQVTDRNLQVEVGGWAAVQVSVGWSGHEVL